MSTKVDSGGTGAHGAPPMIMPCSYAADNRDFSSLYVFIGWKKKGLSTKVDSGETGAHGAPLMIMLCSYAADNRDFSSSYVFIG